MGTTSKVPNASDGHILGNRIAIAEILPLLILPLTIMLLRLSHPLLYAS